MKGGVGCEPLWMFQSLNGKVGGWVVTLFATSQS
jgi:hypothetical protein